jgi:hypothetical protein
LRILRNSWSENGTTVLKVAKAEYCFPNVAAGGRADIHLLTTAIEDAMQQNGTVVLIDTHTGRFGLRVQDGTYLLAEQLDARPLRLGVSLSGQMDAMGVETLSDGYAADKYQVFILAYDLSLEAVEQEFANGS